jgi:hypothetical protein
MTYEKPEAGEWIQPVRRGYKLACCDCGLVHRVDFRIHRGRAQFRVFLAPRSTGQMRRHMLRRREIHGQIRIRRGN